jgi:hypothetical protein
MMNVDADQLGRALNISCLNLGTLSFLDLASNQRLLRHYLANNASQLRTVVLLMHPESLRRFGADPVYRELMDDYFAGRDSRPAPTWNGRLREVLGLHRFQGRLLARLLPSPLAGAFGPEYGFTRDLDRYLTRHRGSALDPTRRSITGNPEYELHPNLEAMSREFRETLPRDIQLVIGITPLPEGFPALDYLAEHQGMLKKWKTWIEADLALEQLPAILPASLFATKTHLNPKGVAVFTKTLGEALTASATERIEIIERKRKP